MNKLNFAPRPARSGPRLTNFLRRAAILPVIVLLSNPVSLLLVGLLNRLTGRPIHSVFTCYPATPRYTEKYCFNFMLPHIRHYPVIVGAFYQGGKLGLVCTISAVERDFQQADFFRKLQRNTRFLQACLGTRTMTYSGILPSAMRKAGTMAPEETERRSSLVAGVVCRAAARVARDENLGRRPDIVLLGGLGSVGSAVRQALVRDGWRVHVVDRGTGFPDALRGQRVMLIDVARKGALESHLPRLWPGMTLLNETYPEPAPVVLRKLAARGITVYHLAGVRARAVPPFPHAYRGGIPCCAMNPEREAEPLLRRLG